MIKVDAVVHKGIPLDCVCDLGYGVAPGTVIDEGMDMTMHGYHVLWPGKPTTNTVCDGHSLHTRVAYAG